MLFRSVSKARIAFGGMAAVPRRAPAAESALEGRAWSPATFEAAQAALARDFTPIADHRASAGYRLRAAAALLRRFFLAYDSRRAGAALRVEDLIMERA